MPLPTDVRRIALDVREAYRRNPPPRLAREQMFQRLLVRAGWKRGLTEGDLIEAAQTAGIPENDVGDFLEEFASWL